MSRGARSPEELEALLEDAFLVFDEQTLTELFEPDAVLVTAGGRSKRGQQAIGRITASMSAGPVCYWADPRTTLQASDLALVLGSKAINVMRRTSEGTWRLVVCFLDMPYLQFDSF